MRWRVELHLVHRNSDYDLFRRAVCGDIRLFYDPIGGLPIGKMFEEDEFWKRAAFPVPREKVMHLREMILRQETPGRILQELGYNKSAFQKHEDDAGISKQGDESTNFVTLSDAIANDLIFPD